MKICQVNPGCGISVPPPGWGEIEKIVWEFTCNLKELGHEVDIRWVNEINSGEYDIVMVHVANLAIQLADRGIPYIFQHHDHHAYVYGKDSYVYQENLQAMERSLFSIVPARYLVNYFDTDKVEYFSHGVNTKEFYPVASLPYHKLLMVANNGLAGNAGHDRKGFELGIKLAMTFNLPITIAGPTNNSNFFNNNPWVYGYPNLNIVYDVSPQDLVKLYQDHTIFIHPSEIEAGHPNLTLVEAAACGLPTVGWIEIETDFNGMWRTPRDLPKLVDGLKYVINNYDKCRTDILQTANNLSWYNRSIDLVKIFERFV